MFNDYEIYKYENACVVSSLDKSGCRIVKPVKWSIGWLGLISKSSL
jgi:hypothetical protein